MANRFITLFDRRLDFLKSERGNMAHSDFFLLRENKDWSQDQMCATLFLTYADVEMSKVVTSLMSKDKLDMVELRAQIRSLESSPWYKGAKQESVKLSGAQGGAPPGGRWCTSCSRSTHNTADCWGVCKWCGGKGHQAEKCRFKKDAKAKEAEIKARKAAEAEKKKKSKNKTMKKKKEGASCSGLT